MTLCVEHLMIITRVAAVILASPSASEAAVPVEAPRVAERFDATSHEAIRSAIERSIPLIESSSAEYLRQRECFSCHHQALSVLSLVEARERGFEIDGQNLALQLERAKTHLKRGENAYREGRGQGGQIDTAGWALWALEEAGQAPDDTTEAVSHYVLNWQAGFGHWKPSGRGRRPTQGSDFTSTYVALRGLSYSSSSKQANQVTDRLDKVRHWLVGATPSDTEDRVFQLRSLHYLSVDNEHVEAAANELLELQHVDGGWAQTSDSESDAYATGTALVALHETGILKADDVAYRRGMAFLLRQQHLDGSWKVETRAKPIQVYFESGFPHERDQFFSMAATCWATQALLKSFSEIDGRSPPLSEAQSSP